MREEAVEVVERIREMDKVLFYEEENSEFRRMSDWGRGDVSLVNLSVSPLLKDMVIKEFEIEELPAAKVYGRILYAGGEERWREIEREEEDREVEKILPLLGKAKGAEGGKPRVVIFIKGTPEEPECGFTRQLVQLFREKGVKRSDYVAYNILSNNLLREGLKRHSRWPTYPQVYVDGEFVGGLDIVRSESEERFGSLFLGKEGGE